MTSIGDQYLNAAASEDDRLWGELVTITRGANSTAGVTATWRENKNEVIDENQLGTQVTGRLWLIKKADYKISDTAVTPRPGDQLTDAAGNAWEVFPDGDVPAVQTYEDANYWEIAAKQVT